MKLRKAHPAQPSEVDAAMVAQRTPRVIATDIIATFSVLGSRADWGALEAIVAAADPALVARLYRPVRGKR